MGIGKSQAAQRPTALGTLLQASTYGATIPTIYGCARSALLAIWVANLRQAGSDKKKKSKKKSPPTYAENIDFLIGSNPIAGLLQFWANQNQVYPLNFLTFRGQPVGGAILDPTWLELTVADAQFYFVCAVTAEVFLSGSFNDYGGFGAVSYSGIYELPLWNGIQHGPDISDPNHNRFPYYLWQPSQGATIAIPNPALIDRFLTAGFWNGFVNVYYAQLSAVIRHHVPASRLRLTFESELGNNSTIYAPAPGQQITYPQYAGVGSPNIDLGAGAAIPNLRPEVMGSYTFIPPRDAEFADMIEDVIRSGVLQVGSELGFVQRGVNCNDLPGPVQSNFFQKNGFSAPAVPFTQPNTVGNVLIASCRFRPGGGGAPTVSDTAGNIWTLLFSDDQRGIWYASPCLASPPGNVVTFIPASGTQFNADAYIMEMDPGSTIVDATSVVTTSAVGPLTASITTTGDVDFIVAITFSDDLLTILTPPLHWKNLFSAALPSWSLVCGRKVSTPGTYTFTKTVIGGGVEVMIALIAFKAAQPTPYPKPLGNIIDYNSLYQVRLQCRAGGLQGSVSLDAQKTAADWLKDFYTCADAAPVWSGFSLKSIPRSEVSAIGQAAVYIAPTASGPIANLTESDFIGDAKNPLITIERKAQVDTNNILQVQHFDRNNMYNQATASQPESGAIALFGPRKLAPTVLTMIMDPAVARKVLAIEVRRLVYLRNIYKFKMQAKWLGLEAMDFITIPLSATMPTIDGQPATTEIIPVRLTKVIENDKNELEAEAEPFIYGVHAPDALAITTAVPYVPPLTTIPASVNIPIIMEPPLRMCLSGKPELWLIVSDSDPNYGGCFDFVSTNFGVSYQQIGTTWGNATTGIVTTDWPAHVDPDPTNPLSVDLTESLGTLNSNTAAERDNFVFPCYVSADIPPSPTFGSATINYGGIEPIECLGINVPAGSAGVGAVWTRFGGYTIFPSGGLSTIARFRQFNNPICGPADHFFVLTHPVGLCPCGATPDTVLDAAPTFFNYDFSTLGFSVNNSGGKIDFNEGSLGSVVPLDETSFDSSTLVPITGGGLLGLFKFYPGLAGNPGLFVAIALNCLGGATPAGWTLVASSASARIYTQAGTHVDPPGANYELMTYETATLTGPHAYTLPATAPAPLRRAVFGMPLPGQGEDHAINTRFAWLNAWQQQPSVNNMFGILKVPLDPTWIGKELHFKFPAFNTFNSAAQNLSDATDYTYTPVGLAFGQAGGGGGNPGQPGQPAYTISGGALTNPTPTTIDMAQAIATFPTNTAVYNARVFTIPAPTVPTVYYVTIYDPGMIGDTSGTNLAAQCLASNTFVGVPGYVYIGSIVALPGGGGTVTGPGGFPLAEQILVNGI